MQQQDGVSEGGYLKYIDYESYMNMVNGKNENIGDYFSIDEKGYLLCSRASYTTTKVSFYGKNGEELSESQIAKIPEENRSEGKTQWAISKTPPINYKNYISKYVLKYDVLTDLLITTQHPDFCTELTALAFNGHITLVIKDELYNSYAKNETTYTNTKATCDYVDYEINGTKTIPGQERAGTIDSGRAASITQIRTNGYYGWTPNGSPYMTLNNSTTYRWKYSGQTYQLTFLPSTGIWYLQTITKDPDTHQALQSKTGSNEFIKGGTNEEFGDYTEYEEFTYTVVREYSGQGHVYTFETAEIDTWFAKYEKFKDGYGKIEEKTSGSGKSKPVKRPGQFVEEEPEILRDTEEINAKAAGNGLISSFISNKETQYKTTTGADEAKCNITQLTIKTSNKEDAIILSNSSVTRYKFVEEEESEVDLTKIDFKNIKFIDNKATFTDDDKYGFLYLFDVHNKRKDLFLTHDAETKLFVLLEEGKDDVYAYLLKALLSVYDGVDRGVSLDQLRLLFRVRPIIIHGGLSAFGCKLDRDEFIEKAEKYGGALAELAASFYDVCEKYNVNPCVAYAWAVVESGNGTSDKAIYAKNLFGMGVGNTSDAGIGYDTYEDSIEDFCKWVENAGTPGTDGYRGALEQAEVFSQVNENFTKPPEKNMYSLFCRYMYLGDTHICDDPGCADDPAKFKEECKRNKSNSGSGGRYIIYHMYELGGLYTGEYAMRCGHPNGTDPTTTTEKADYVQYSVSQRVKIAKSIFGNGCIVGSFGIVEAAYEVGRHYLEDGPAVHYAGDSVKFADNNGRHVISGPGSVQRTWDIVPDGNPGSYGIVCATFVSLALWKAEVVEASWLETHKWHSTAIGNQLLELPGWTYIGFGLGEEELEEGDVIVFPKGEHIYIYVGGGRYIDQNYCAIRSDGSDGRGHLGGISLDITGAVYRYELN